MTQRKNVYKFLTVGYDSQVNEMLKEYGHEWIPLSKLGQEKFDIALFLGGEDVFPFLYNQKKHPTTDFSLRRDMHELSIWHKVGLSTPKVGICRGGQFLNIMSGGSMYQDVDGHCQSHPAVSYTMDEMIVTSTHHQMMRPAPYAWTILSAKESLRKETDQEVFRKGDLEWDEEDTEVCYYGDTNSLCFQPHPEYSFVPECRKFFFECIDMLFQSDIEKKNNPPAQKNNKDK